MGSIGENAIANQDTDDKVDFSPTFASTIPSFNDGKCPRLGYFISFVMQPCLVYNAEGENGTLVAATRLRWKQDEDVPW